MHSHTVTSMPLLAPIYRTMLAGHERSMFMQQ